MAKTEETSYSCDKCGKNLKNASGTDIMTSLSESLSWSRLHVNIILRSGMHNDATEEKADLCKTCTLALLMDAVKRIRKGERSTAGTESSEQKGW